MPTASQEQPRRGRPPTLTRDQVARIALDIVDREGLDALSMPRLARDLGVGTMTLYGYVRDKDDLLDSVVDAAVADIELAPPAEHWRARVTDLLDAVHDLLNHHPAIVAIRLHKPVVRPEALRFGDLVMGYLLEAGLKPADAASSFRLLFTYVFGFAGLSPDVTTQSDRQRATEALERLDPDEHPTLTAHTAEFAQAISGEHEYRFGLDRILDGIQSLLPQVHDV